MMMMLHLNGLVLRIQMRSGLDNSLDMWLKIAIDSLEAPLGWPLARDFVSLERNKYDTIVPILDR